MGGHAFDDADDPALAISRIPASAYPELATNVLTALRPFYARVELSINAPEKPDHGDIDLLAEGPTATLAAQAAALGAVRAKASGPQLLFAVPLATSSLFQVDVLVCPPGTLDWNVFRSAHGDLWLILSRALSRPYGLTATPAGLHLRIPELEPHNRRASLVLLSASPPAIAAFLGLDLPRHAAGFATVDALFAWIASCPLLARRSANPPPAADKNCATRPLYARFFTEWLPRQAHVPLDPPETREEVRVRALRVFGKQAEYDARLGPGLREVADGRAAARIVEVLEGVGGSRDAANLAVRAVRRWVVWEPEAEEVVRLLDVPDVEGGRGAWLGELLVGEGEVEKLAPGFEEWLVGNHEQLRALERRRVKEGKARRLAAAAAAAAIAAGSDAQVAESVNAAQVAGGQEEGVSGR